MLHLQRLFANKYGLHSKVRCHPKAKSALDEASVAQFGSYLKFGQLSTGNISEHQMELF